MAASRVNQYAGPRQDFLSVLTSSGQGTYYAEAWAKMASGSTEDAKITMDADSTVKSVCGNQEEAAKGYNTTKKGSRCMNTIFIRPTGKSLIFRQAQYNAGSTKPHNNRKEENMNTNLRVYGSGAFT